MAVRLFHALKVESQSLRFVIQEATVSLASAYKVCTFMLNICVNMLLIHAFLLNILLKL